MAELEKVHRNCCQKTLAACANEKIDTETAYLLGTYFGSGMHFGEVCGAVTGALMALGLEFGDDMGKKKLSDEFIAAFKEKFGSLLCRDLKGADKAVPCPVLIEEAIKMTKEIMGK